MTTRTMPLARYIPLAVCLALVGVPALAQEINVFKVTLRVKELNSWTTTPGRLFKVTEKGRSYAAEIDVDGKLDAEVKCRKGDRFEADAESYFDRPTPPPRLTCSETLVFQFVRAIYAAWSKAANSPSEELAVAPFLYSELTARTLKSGRYDAALAFSDAAIASTALLLGDSNMDQYVARAAGQDFRLVFNEVGTEALRVKQKSGGLKPTGQLDAATQFLFLKDLPEARAGSRTAYTPAVSCAQGYGKFLCITGGPHMLPKSASNSIVILPAFEVRQR